MKRYVWFSYDSPYWRVWEVTNEDLTPKVVHQCSTKRNAKRWLVSYSAGLTYVAGVQP